MTRTREENAADLSLEEAPRRRTYDVSILIQIDDEAALLAAARKKAVDDGDLTEEDATAMDVSDALRWLLDPGESPPGTSIQDSTVEGPA